MRLGLALLAIGCSAPSNSGAPTDASHHPGDGSAPSDGKQGHDDAGGPTDSGTPLGTPMTCPGPGNPKNNGGSCGSERWDIKTGTDAHAGAISLVPQPNTIAALVALPAAGAGTARESPTETTVYELKDVILTELKMESDSDYHMVLSDGSKTLIAEIPAPSCATGSVWSCFISRSRSEVDAKYTVSTSPQYPSATVTVRGVGFFDYLHGQNGVAPNAIELHPVLEVCFGQGCTPD